MKPSLCKVEGRIRIPSGGEIIDIEWITFENRAWLVPSWFVSPDEQFLQPQRIIAPKFAPEFEPLPGPDVLQTFQQLQLPPSLLEQGVIPPEIAPVIEVRENPELVVRNPDVLN